MDGVTDDMGLMIPEAGSVVRNLYLGGMAAMVGAHPLLRLAPCSGLRGLL